MSRIGPPVALLIAAALAGLAACSSGEFGPLGGDLPGDVTQDSVAIAIDPIFATDVVTFDSPLSVPLEERQLIYLGHRDSGNWRATPVMRFDFSELPDTLDFSPANVVRADLQLRVRSADADLGLPRMTSLYVLADTLRSGWSDTLSSAVLGTNIGVSTDAVGESWILPIPIDSVSAWVGAKAHRGLALLDESATPNTLDNNFMALASSRLLRRSEFNIFENETFVPEIVVELSLPSGTFVAIPVGLHYTIFESDPIPANAPTLGSLLAKRSALAFSIPDSVLPGNATVNLATLELRLEPVLSLGRHGFDLQAYSEPSANIQDVSTADASFIFRSNGRVVPGTTTSITLDLTDYVQRRVNGTLSEDDQVLLALSDESYLLGLAVMHPSDSPVDSLRPRLEITFTPPADFWE